jgi:hypothetical protein
VGRIGVQSRHAPSKTAGGAHGRPNRELNVPQGTGRFKASADGGPDRRTVRQWHLGEATAEVPDGQVAATRCALVLGNEGLRRDMLRR